MSALLLLARYFSASVRGQMQYPGSALALGVAQFFATIIDILAAWALFDRFGPVQGWTFGDIALFFGMVSVSFAIADFLSRGFDVFGTSFVRTGDFDRVLLRPRSAALQLIGYEFRLSRIGRLAQGLVVIGLSTSVLGLDWHADKILLAIWTIAGGVALFIGLMVLQATLAFWTVESLEVMNLLTYGGVQASQFPLSIYADWFRNFLIFVIPLGCVAYFPVLALLGKPDPLGAPDWLLPLTPAAGFVFLGISFLAWRFGVAKYTSTGS
ncbi:MAG TPA: ABC-2 family transporter protein [Phenylobacterium sp.]|uniref:ABC transporter permease n=1 Tax=Phenylobacterium sp. TaxID=1871053 RepID=UPI002F925567